MTRWRVLFAAALMAGAAWLAVAAGVGRDEPEPAFDRPAVLVDLGAQEVSSFVVRDPRSGVATEVTVRDDRLSLDDSADEEITPEELRQLREELSPMLAVRLLPGERPEFGLGRPALEVELVAASGPTAFEIGDFNFDRSAVYVRVGERVALILPRIAEALRALVGQAPP